MSKPDYVSIGGVDITDMVLDVTVDDSPCRRSPLPKPGFELPSHLWLGGPFFPCPPLHLFRNGLIPIIPPKEETR